MTEWLQLWQDSLENDAHPEGIQINSAEPIYTHIYVNTHIHRETLTLKRNVNGLQKLVIPCMHGGRRVSRPCWNVLSRPLTFGSAFSHNGKPRLPSSWPGLRNGYRGINRFKSTSWQREWMAVLPKVMKSSEMRRGLSSPHLISDTVSHSGQSDLVKRNRFNQRLYLSLVEVRFFSEGVNDLRCRACVCVCDQELFLARAQLLLHFWDFA